MSDAVQLTANTGHAESRMGQWLGIQRHTTTPGGEGLEEVGQGCLFGHFFGKREFP